LKNQQKGGGAKVSPLFLFTLQTMGRTVDIFGYEELEVRVYDPETKQVIKSYDTITKAAAYLGLTTTVVKNRCKNRGREFSPSLKKEVAIRLVNKNKL